jgi:7-alpha-hydroxysteroid dehydrogenase
MVLERFRMTGQVAIVTGAGRGIGRGIALALAEAGARVVCAARTQAQITETAEACQALGVEARAIRCDVNDPDQCAALVGATAEAFGQIDVLVNNAGGTLPAPALKLKDETFVDAFKFNVGSGFRLTKLVAPHMLTRETGAIINISSALSHYVESGFVAYGTAKAALNHMTRLLACEFAPLIRVNAIAAGAIETEALKPLFGTGDLKAKMVALTPMARLGEVEDIAAMALYLASGASSWVTGKVFEVDGGTVASTWPMKIPGY